MQRVKELDGLRAIAILAVMACHYEGFVRLTGYASEFGWVGVDIFFVLSGYLITTILLGLRSKPRPYITFYSRRTIRIFPPYFVCVFLIIFLEIVSRNHAVLTISYLVKQFFFLQASNSRYLAFMVAWLLHPLRQLSELPGLLQNAHALPPGQAGLEPGISSQSAIYWSLSIEEWFYLLWAPLVLRLPERAIVAIGCAICVIEILLRWSWGKADGYFGIFFRFDALVYGALLALLLKRWSSKSFPLQLPRWFTAIFAICILLIGMMFFVLRPVIGFEIRDSPLFLAFGLPAVSIASASVVSLLIVRANSNWWFARLMRTSLMQFVGTISYTVYLVHILAAWAVASILVRLVSRESLPFLVIEGILSGVLALAIARISWHFMEKPLLRWKDRRFPSQRVAEPVLN